MQVLTWMGTQTDELAPVLPVLPNQVVTLMRFCFAFNLSHL